MLIMYDVDRVVRGRDQKRIPTLTGRLKVWAENKKEAIAKASGDLELLAVGFEEQPIRIICRTKRNESTK